MLFLDLKQRYKHLFVFLILALIGLGLFRTGLLALYFNRIDTQLVPELLLQGLRFDLLTVAYLLVLPLFISVLAPASASSLVSTFLRIYYRSLFILLVTMEGVGLGFLIEYDHRPDVLFWEYLKYPHEVSSMLFGGYRLEIVGTLLVGFLAFLAGKRWLLPQNLVLHGRKGPAAIPIHFAVFLACTVLLTGSIRSSLGHRPANISNAQFSDNRLANELALNSTYTAAYARYSRRYDNDNVSLYGRMGFLEAVDLVQSTSQPPGTQSNDELIPTLHQVRPTVSIPRPRNIVIVLEESLGARFVGALGGANLTPNFDRLSKSGLLFTNLYATGTRTTRGIEAVLSGFPPSASQSIVKRSKSRRNFFTLAQLLKQHGYKNYFVYGGEPNFDDMGGFMSGNGFDSLIAGAKQFPEARFKGSWGVSDEDWAHRAHQVFEQANEEGPFFGFMLSTSNHSPWEFPSGRIKPGPGPLASRENAVRYSDYALGEFFKLAELSDYYENTIFLVVADHDSRVYGDEFVPIDYFHIPGLLIGKDLKPGHYDRLASQIDLVPTLLPLLGITTETPTIGQDLLVESLTGPGRAIMQYGLNNALMVGDDVLVRLPFRDPKQFIRTASGLENAEVDEDLAQLSLAYLTLANDLYHKQVYRLPDVIDYQPPENKKAAVSK